MCSLRYLVLLGCVFLLSVLAEPILSVEDDGFQQADELEPGGVYQFIPVKGHYSYGKLRRSADFPSAYAKRAQFLRIG
nr:neuropeptide [Hymenolepis microstoma]